MRINSNKSLAVDVRGLTASNENDNPNCLGTTLIKYNNLIMEKEKFISLTKELISYAREKIEEEIESWQSIKLDFNSFIEQDIDWYQQLQDAGRYIVELEEELRKPIAEVDIENYRDKIDAILSVDLVDDAIGDSPLKDNEEEYRDYLYSLPIRRYCHS